MTHDEISKLSDKELNELIAKQRGWRKWRGMWASGSNPPDFCNSWQWAGELLETINNPKLARHGDFWICTADSGMAHTCRADSPTRAIAEAYAIMECVG